MRRMKAAFHGLPSSSQDAGCKMNTPKTSITIMQTSKNLIHAPDLTSRRTFLVTGATGDTGGATVEQMLSRGHHVRALAHRQDERAKRLQGLGAEVVFGDFLNLHDVRAALRGVAGAYFCYPIRPGIIQATAFFAQAAKEAGVACGGEHVAGLGPRGRKESCRTRPLASRAYPITISAFEQSLFRDRHGS